MSSEQPFDISVMEDSLADYLAKEVHRKLMDESFVWPSPELQREADEWRARFKEDEQRLLYGDGSAEPKGILHAKGKTCR